LSENIARIVSLVENVINATDDVIFYKDLALRYIGCNEAFLRFAGKQVAEEVVGKTDEEIFDISQAELFRRTDTQVLESGQTQEHEKWVVYPDGVSVYQHTKKSPIRDESGQIFGVMGISRDITAEHRLKEEFYKQHQYARALLDAQENLLIVTNDGISVIDANQACYTFLGQATCNLNGTYDTCINDYVVIREGYVPILKDRAWLPYVTGTSTLSHKVIVKSPASGQEHIFSLTVKKLEIDDYYLITLNDITTVENEKIYFQTKSKYDALTQLYNRAYIMEELHRFLHRARSANIGFCLILIDVDHFKQINDTYGHISGDEVLKGLSLILQESLRSDDIVGRYGGEEFMVLLPKVNIENAQKVCEKLRSQVERHHFVIDENDLRITISLGLAAFHPGESDSALLKRADDALYASKTGGRNRTTLSQ